MYSLIPGAPGYEANIVYVYVCTPIVLKWQNECTKVNITTFEIVVLELNHEFLNLPNRLFVFFVESVQTGHA